jgi:hypothetical protein
MDQSSTSDLAWDLVDEMRSCLSAEALDSLFVRLGCGDYEEVIETVLTSVARGATLTPHLLGRLAVYAKGYGSGSNQHRLYGLVSFAAGLPDNPMI